MIALNVTYQCKPGKRDEFLEKILAEGIDTASRAEAGNFRYVFYLPADGSDELLLVEKWTDAGALSEHLKKPHLVRLGELKSEYVIDAAIEKYEVR